MGYLRLFLAFVIMATHLAGTNTRWGAVAVMIFYAMAGYFAVLSMNRPGAKPIPFLVSRWFRLWPSYICVFAVTCAAFSFGWIDTVGGDALGWGFLRQVFMVVPAWPVGGIIAPAWMLKYLLLGYFLIAIGAADTPQRAATGVILLTLWANSIALMPGLPYGGYYLSAAFGLQFMMAGACCYHLGLVCPRDRKWAAWAGALSYPVFLAHYPIGAAVISATGLEVGWPLFWLSLPITLAVSWLLCRFVERPVAKIQLNHRPENG